jgi:hypothetical protein
MIEFKSRALTWRFWELLSRFFSLKNKFKGTLREYAMELDFSLSDGFFYTYILPVLIKNNILIDSGESDKIGYRGRFGKIYIFDKDNLSKFFIKNNPIARKIFKTWVIEGDVDPDWL